MIYSLSGKLMAKKENFLLVDVQGVGYKIYVSPRIQEEPLSVGEHITVFSYLNVKEDALDLYGFLKESDLAFFEKLITVNGIGPKSALALMAIAPVDQLAAAINEGDPELLTRAAGIGRKIAERVVLELKGRLPLFQSLQAVETMKSDLDLEDALLSLGYNKASVRGAVRKIDSKLTSLESRLRSALKLLKK